MRPRTGAWSNSVAKWESEVMAEINDKIEADMVDQKDAPASVQ